LLQATKCVLVVTMYQGGFMRP